VITFLIVLLYEKKINANYFSSSVFMEDAISLKKKFILKTYISVKHKKFNQL